MQNLIIPIQN